VHHPPAPVGIHRLVRGIDHARQIQEGSGDQAEEQDEAGGRAPRTPEQGHADVKNKQQHIDHDEIIQRARDFEKLAAFPPVHVKAGDGNHPHNDQAGKLDQGECGRKQFASCLVRNDEIRSAHKAAQEPYDQQVVVTSPGRVEWDVVVQDVIPHMGKGHDKAVDNLQAQQQHGYRKKIVGNPLRLIFHVALLPSYPLALRHSGGRNPPCLPLAKGVKTYVQVLSAASFSRGMKPARRHLPESGAASA
jgi:hypothetical protein